MREICGKYEDNMKKSVGRMKKLCVKKENIIMENIKENMKEIWERYEGKTWRNMQKIWRKYERNNMKEICPRVHIWGGELRIFQLPKPQEIWRNEEDMKKCASLYMGPGTWKNSGPTLA